ncbi:hypothetical protein Cpap_0454 [Ruminiclostridium papyrosolvens DSM 2782]|uniref:Sporulation stage 0, Spo0E-like regulatory phosphatase n=1 Tax=Ruminiclostridium papyrosolvens DSM 2782 TaxID=588581 RepID=F1THF7_9FIRM|nr:aspartyl-phosphate phosphatase Spo0E family protein [Ruminiclostridium papyrosolvens]EGD46160.1 hypothetical protein Cpap_0454 [Ruminiclostridium papyrosolvens DSM 2782]WES35943.1 aspartyl-phosphate phosphatase Spo0E family protein [Ruminiclostridium papyrosolvens DSM 2782]
MKTEEKIEELRQKLHEMILLDKDNMDHIKVLEMSQQIDKYIVRYMEKSEEMKKAEPTNDINML